MNKLTALTTAACLLAAPALQAKDLALSYFMGPNHPLNEAVFTPFAEKLAEVSGGQLTVTQYPGGALNSSPPKQYSILLDGIADVAFHLPGYTAQIFPITTAITTPGMCGDALECTEAMWRAIEPIEAEFDAKLLAVWANDPQVLYTKDKAVRTLEDMQGLLVRVTSAQDIPFTEALGASSVSQPVSEINQNLANGVVDAVSIDPSATMSFKMHEPANYMTTNIPGAGSAFVLMMNKGVYNALTEEEKGWVDEASGKWLSMKGGQIYRDMAERGIEVARENGVEIIELSAEERARWDAAIQPALDEWMATDLGQGMTGADLARLFKGE
ncbi:TRAP transporter substrate-binding protein [Vannielia litorea]|uniref:TRAP-type C4-dicarboxylate transport system, substrate-binding protein n=1 Tax=Vannielia litorea TaxID=1217970 RepID=A0A1N6GV18_9RHOB|nr:TRAP transporter substrate-binding protein [Vannielia litorea]SIO11195.1 TRAP-type C4-dicarboxylate transport system, substrate-binding protein [Vannielia litorea]